MSRFPRVQPRAATLPLLLFAALAAVAMTLMLSSTAAAAPSKAAARDHAKSPSVRYRAADAAFVRTARKLAACQVTQPRNCASVARTLQRRGRTLQRHERSLARGARRVSSSQLAAQLKAPTLTAIGTKLSWTKVSNVGTYVVKRSIRGSADTFTVVNGTSTTPAAVAGKTARYGVRTAVTGSRWSSDVSISYPSTQQPSKPQQPSTPQQPAPQQPAPEQPAPQEPAPEQPAPQQPATSDRLAAPTLRVSGTTLQWSKVADVDRYVLVQKVSGSSDRYWVESGTSHTPAALPGKTATYSVRADVSGSKWATEVKIAYPKASEPAPTAPQQPQEPQPQQPTEPAPQQPTEPEPAPASGFTAGVVAGSAVDWELRFATALGAKSARMEFSIGTPASQLERYVDMYARAGIRPLLLAGFHGRTPTATEAKNLASWAAAFGPGGTFWQGKSYPAGTAVTHIEFGNESSYNYQYSAISGNSNWANTTFYKDLATQYALRFKDAHVAIQSANPRVGLLAVGDTPGNWGTWMSSMFNAVPDLGQRVAGWTVHPYGPDWQSRIDGTLNNAKAQGAPATIPVHVTEFGVSSDNGRCLSDNYGWNKCMTYDQAGSTLTQSIQSMRSRYGSRLQSLYVYHAHDLANSGASSDREAFFGALKLDGSAKGGLTTAVRSFLGS